MKNKFWCISTSDPLVRQVAEKHNISTKDAWTIINNARKEDKTLNDNKVTLELLEQSKAFQDAFSSFANDRADEVDVLLEDLPEKKQTLDKTLKELNAIYSSEFDEDRVEELMEMYTQTKEQVRKSKRSARHIANLMKNFKNSERLQFLGDWVCWATSRIVTLSMTDAKYAEKLGVPVLGNRQDYYTDPATFSKIKSFVLYCLDKAAKKLKSKGGTANLELAKELNCFLFRDSSGNIIKDNVNNLDTLYAIFGGNLFREEGIKFNIEGSPSNTDSRIDSAERTNGDDEIADEDDDSTNEEICHSSFSSDDTSKSAYSKIAGSLKRILYNMAQTDSSGAVKTDDFGYGLEQPLDVPKAVNKLLSIVQGCTNYTEMVEALEQHSDRTPWISTLLNALNTDTDTDDTGAITSSSRKEELQNEVFQSLNLTFTELRGSYKRLGPGGTPYFLNYSTNVNNKGENALRKAKYALTSMKGIGITKNGGISPEAIAKVIEKVNKIKKEAVEVRSGMAKILPGKRVDFSEYRDGISKVSKDFMNMLETDLGIKINRETMNDFLSSAKLSVTSKKKNNAYYKEFYSAQISKMHSELENVTRLLDRLRKYATEDNGIYAKTNPFYIGFKQKGSSGYDDALVITRFYNLIIDDLTKESADSKEPFAHNKASKNKRYSYSMPTTIQKILRNLQHKDLAKRQKYIMEHYGNDPWFIKESSTPGKPEFYSTLLNDLYYGLDDNIEYSEKPFFDSTEYMEQSDKEYALNILTDYFLPKKPREKRAFSRLAISGDKKRYSSMYLSKYDDRDPLSKSYYKTKITEVARGAFAQELYRAIRVVDYAADNKGDKATIKGYDIKIPKDNKPKSIAIREVFKKIKAGEKVTTKDVVADGEYIFRSTGASFYFNKFINDCIEYAAVFSEDEASDNEVIEAIVKLGNYAVDKIFNRGLLTESKDIIEPEIIDYFEKGFSNYMDSLKDNFMQTLENAGVLEEVTIKFEEGKASHLKYIYQNLLNWHRDTPSYLANMYDSGIAEAEAEGVDLSNEKNQHRLAAFAEKALLKEDVEEFVYNNWLAKYNTIQIFDVDLAFYATTPDFQKRAAQRVSAGSYFNPDAKIHGETVHDGKFRTITISSGKTKSQNATNIEIEQLKALLKETDPKRRKLVEDEINSICNKLINGYDATDGQAVSCLTSVRKKMIGLKGWTRSATKEMDEIGFETNPDGTFKLDADGNKIPIMTHEAVYNRIKNKEQVPEDNLFVINQVLKPMVMSHTKVKRDGKTVTVPVQNKNSEYLLNYLSAFSPWSKNKGEDKHTLMEGVNRFMEETAELFPGRGIDTVNFDSAVKTGLNSKVIDISDCKNGQEVYEKLVNAVLNEDKSGYREDGVVTEYDASDYKTVSEKGEHYKKNHQPSGSQFSVLVINGVPDNGTATLSNGKEITGKELKDRYIKARARKTKKNVERFRSELGMDLPYEARIHKISNMLKDSMATDERFTPEMRDSVSVVERDGVLQFKTPLDESQLQPAVEAMLMSKIRNAHYDLKTNGGITVQATSWGSADDLGIRFYSTNPEDSDGLIPKKNDFGKAHNLTGNKLDKEYKKYCKKYQSGYAYMEIEITMPDYVAKMLIAKSGSLVPYMNSDGTWNMEKIKKVVPEKVFDAICYRLPTEAKYSMMLCKVVRFSKEGSGSVAKYPSEIVLFTGSDFDIDTDTVELRPVDKDVDYEVDEELFDLQVAALRMNSSLLESFRDGDFSDVKELSYRLTLLGNGYTQEQIDSMDPRELKDACDAVEDKDIMDPSSDIILYRQNADAKQMIAVAAVGVTSHAFISLYNDVDKSNPQMDPQVHPENFTTIAFVGGEQHYEPFRVVNDKDADNVTSMLVGGELKIKSTNRAILDPVYDMDGHFVGTEISKYVGGSADAAKDAALYRLNINMATLGILVLMHRLGISSDVARLFIANPVIRRLAAHKINSTSFGKTKSPEDAVGDIMDEFIIEELRKEEGNRVINSVDDGYQMYLDIMADQNKELRYSSLLYAIKHPETQTLQDKFLLLIIIDTLGRKSNSVRNLDSFTRYNSRNTMRGASFLDRLTKREKIVRLRSNLNSNGQPIISLPKKVETSNEFENTEYDRLCAMYPYIGQIIANEEELLGNIMSDFMKTYSPSFFEVANRLDIQDNTDAMKALYAGYKNYLLFVGPNKIADFSDESTVKYYTMDFADHFSAEKKTLAEDSRFKNNEFLSEVTPERVPDGYKEFNILTTNILGLKGPSLEKFQKDWDALLDYPETRKLAIDTAIHFLARSAAFSRNTPISVMPERIKDAIPNYKKAFYDANKISMSEEKMDLFLNLFMRHNPENKDIVPRFYNTDRYTNAIEEIDPETKLPVLLLRSGKTSDKIFIKEEESETTKILKPIVSVEEGGNTVLFALMSLGSESIKLVERDGVKYFSVPAVPVSPLGIPNVMAEYVGQQLAESPLSIFEPTEEAHAADEQNTENRDAVKSEKDIAEPNEEVSSRSLYSELIEVSTTDYNAASSNIIGTVIESIPFGSDEVDINDPYLTKDSISNNNSYLETRTHMNRVRRLSDAMGFRVEAARSAISDNSNAVYNIDVTPKEYTVDQHAEAVSVAAILGSLGYKSGSTVVKTYVPIQDAEEGKEMPNAYELSLLANKEKAKSAAKYLNKLGKKIAWNINSATGEITITRPFNPNKFDSAAKDIYAMADKVNDIIQKLSKEGILERDYPELNFCYYTELDGKKKLEILKSLRNELSEDQSAKKTGRKSETTRGENWEQVQLDDIVDLAIRREEGQEVEDEVRRLFGERQKPLISPNSSYESRKLVDNVFGSLSEDTQLEIQDMLDSKEFSGHNITNKVNALIVNTANWIRGNTPERAISKSLEMTGLTEESSRSIMNVIKEYLEDQNIC